VSDANDWTCRFEPYDALGRDALYELLQLRCEVFVVGQAITAVPEIDGRDPACTHARLFEGDALVGTARLVESDEPISVGRVAVHPDRQREGIGTYLMERIQARLGDRRAELHAQAHLEDWYASLGWERVGDVFMEAEMPHVHMVWNGC
jgi:ElaA protein